MTRPRRFRSLALATALAVLFASAIAIEVLRDRLYGEPVPGRQVLYIRSSEAMKRMSLSYSAVLADIYWIRALQYYGGTRLSTGGTRDYSLLYPLLDITTTLDPHFRIAYRFGAIFLAERFPGGAGRLDLAVALLKKGVRNSPGHWRYLQDIGFVYYWWGDDYREAAAWFRRASEVPGAPWWMKSLAATTLAQGGDRASSRLLWESQLAAAENDWLRRDARRRLQQLDALDQVDQLQALVRLYASRTGTFPASWETLVRVRYIRSIPVDPTGTAYTLDSQTGVVAVSPDSPLQPLPTGDRSRLTPPR